MKNGSFANFFLTLSTIVYFSKLDTKFESSYAHWNIQNEATSLSQLLQSHMPGYRTSFHLAWIHQSTKKMLNCFCAQFTY